MLGERRSRWRKGQLTGSWRGSSCIASRATRWKQNVADLNPTCFRSSLRAFLSTEWVLIEAFLQSQSSSFAELCSQRQKFHHGGRWVWLHQKRTNSMGSGDSRLNIHTAHLVCSAPSSKRSVRLAWNLCMFVCKETTCDCIGDSSMATDQKQFGSIFLKFIGTYVRVDWYC